MAGDARGEGAERFDDENEQDGLGAAEIAFHARGVGVDEQQRFPNGFDEIVGQEQEIEQKREQEGLAGFPFPDIREKPQDAPHRIALGAGRYRGRFGHGLSSPGIRTERRLRPYCG